MHIKNFGGGKNRKITGVKAVPSILTGYIDFFCASHTLYLFLPELSIGYISKATPSAI